MREDTKLVLAKSTEATLETRLQEQGGKLDLRGEISSLPCCVFLRLLVLQINQGDTTLVSAKGTEATLETGLQEQGASWASRVQF